MLTRCWLAVILLCSAALAQDDPLKSDKGVIRDARSAVAVGVAILSSVYGEEKVHRGGPYRAKLVKDEWEIEADLPQLKPGEARFGGGYYITLSRKDGRVIGMGFDE